MTFCKRRTDPNAGGVEGAGYETKDVMKKFAVYGFHWAGVSGTVHWNLTRNIRLAGCVGCDLDEGYGIAKYPVEFPSSHRRDFAILCSLICSVQLHCGLPAAELHEQATASSYSCESSRSWVEDSPEAHSVHLGVVSASP